MILPVLLALLQPDPVFAENFEQFDRKHWNELKGWGKQVRIVDGGYRSKKCVEITATLGEDTGGHLYRMLDPGLDTAHLRFYVKFDREHGYVHHFVTLTGYNPPTRWPQGGAGERPKGNERFSTGIEPWGFWGRHPAPGAWNFYTYWCEMKGSPDGKYWGNSFAPDPPVPVVRDRWTCIEIMLKCNSSPDKADGEQALWIDGKERGRWKNFRWRKDPKLRVNGVWMLDYITPGAARQNRVKNPRRVNRVRFDEIVVARSYIGPLKE